MELSAAPAGPAPRSAAPPPVNDASGGDGAGAFTPGGPEDALRLGGGEAMEEAESILEAEGVCPPNLEQGTSEEAGASLRVERRAVVREERERGGGRGVVAGHRTGRGVVYVGSSDRYFYALNNLTGAVEWKMYTDGPIQSSAAIDSDGQLYFATDAGTIYQVVEAVPSPPLGQK